MKLFPIRRPEQSPAQSAYLERERFRRQKNAVLRVMILVLILALWELGALTGAVDDFIFSSPSRIAGCFWSMAGNGSIFFHTGVTLWETAVSFFFTTALGLLLAILLWASPEASEILEPYLVILNSLPKSALAPLLIVWLGANLRTIVVAAVSVAVFGSVMTLYTSFSRTDPELIRLIRSFGGGRKDVLFKILLPASVPVIINSMKVSIGLCLVGVIIGEFLAADAGLGYLIIYGQQTFAMDEVVMSIVILCVISALFYKGISLLERRAGRLAGKPAR
ncbi:MAG TPA: ABC transporter permease [Candidatus Lachnoclostridium pullistercoris]|uniref:ABC transporter permease n=1 Tax=Candidatus Lachnoclostridium pullistercoris TaxID=2838632 RepID=A0A9D2T6F9_9FIRM|nr:ABC transporter permease [Candidatus Lachnoclostridium pullistercoris]